jgi:AraC family transcriptional regulator
VISVKPNIIAEIRSPWADAQLLEYDWPAPIETESRETRHMLEMSLPPLANEGIGCFPEIAPPRYSSIGGVFLRPAGILLRARAPRGHRRVVRCAMAPERFTEITQHDGTWTEAELRACLDLRNETPRALLHRLYAELLSPGLASAALVEAYATALVIEVMRPLHGLREAQPGGQLAPWQYRRITARIMETGPAPSVSELAGLCNISPRHLLRLYRAFAGETVTACIARGQAERARQMLRETRLSVKEIAGRLGFARATSFSSAFRRAAGITPRQYRQTGGQSSPQSGTRPIKTEE